MTPSELEGALARLGWTTHHLAARTGYREPDVYAWIDGQTKPPPLVPEYLRVMLLLQEAVG